MKKLFMLITIIYIAFIFSLSIDIYSNDKSLQVSQAITTKISDPNSNAPLESPTVKKINFMIRKGAHFFPYFFFAIILSIGAINFKFKLSSAAGYILFLCLLIANIDELIQKYVGHRTSDVKDCLIDLCGAACGMILVLFIDAIVKRHVSAETLS